VWLALAVTLLALIGCADRARGPEVPGGAVVEDVIDGDTIDVVIDGQDERVRLLGIDTPEVHVDDGEVPECYGAEASAHVSELLPRGTEVRLERDVVGRDDYGRLLAYVYVLDSGVLVNEAIVRDGYARVMRIEPNGAMHTRLVAAAMAADAAGLGLWSACAG